MNYDQFKQAIGIGYRKNIWDVSLSFNNKNYFDRIQKDILKRLPQNTNFADMYSKSGYYQCLASTANLPGIGITQTTEISRNRTYITDLKNSSTASLSIINDQWNYNYLFWRYYFANMSSGYTVCYPSEYYFDMTLTIQNPPINSTPKDVYIFRNCYASTAPGDQDFNRQQTSEIATFTIQITFEDVVHLFKNKSSEQT